MMPLSKVAVAAQQLSTAATTNVARDCVGLCSRRRVAESREGRADHIIIVIDDSGQARDPLLFDLFA